MVDTATKRVKDLENLGSGGLWNMGIVNRVCPCVCAVALQDVDPGPIERSCFLSSNDPKWDFPCTRLCCAHPSHLSQSNCFGK